MIWLAKMPCSLERQGGNWMIWRARLFSVEILRPPDSVNEHLCLTRCVVSGRTWTCSFTCPADSSLLRKSSVHEANLSSSSLVASTLHHAIITPTMLGTNVPLSGKLVASSAQSISHSRLHVTLRPMTPSNVSIDLRTAHVGPSNWSRMSTFIFSGLLIVNVVGSVNPEAE